MASRGIRRAVLAAGGVAAVVLPVAVPLLVASPSTAAAVATTHSIKFVGRGTGSPMLIEPKLKLKESCNSSTGAWTVSASGIQVIGPDGVTPFDTRNGQYVLSVTLAAEQTFVPLKQDPKTALFDANFTSTLIKKTDCFSGASTAITATTNHDIEVALKNLGLLL